MSRKALVLLVCCCDFRDRAERLIPSKSLRNAVIRAFPGLLRILRMCAPRRAAAVVRPRGREKSADRRRRILISRLLIIRASVPRWKSPFPAYFKGFPAVSPLIPPYPTFLKYPVSPHYEIQQRIAPVAKQYGVKAVFLFGSYARGEAREDSDIDLLVDTSGTNLRSLLSLGALYCDLEAALQKPIDLITVSALEQRAQMPSEEMFRETVMKEKLNVYDAA